MRLAEGTGQLYDLQTDPYETTDLWTERPEIVEELTALMVSYRMEGRSAPSSD